MIDYSADYEVRRLIKKYDGFDFPKIVEVCEKLKTANARIEINGVATVLGNRSIGWVVLTLRDKDSGVSTSDFSSHNTSVSAELS
jgi:hypothetical protein